MRPTPSSDFLFSFMIAHVSLRWSVGSRSNRMRVASSYSVMPQAPHTTRLRYAMGSSFAQSGNTESSPNMYASRRCSAVIPFWVSNHFRFFSNELVVARVASHAIHGPVITRINSHRPSHTALSVGYHEILGLKLLTLRAQLVLAAAPPAPEGYDSDGAPHVDYPAGNMFKKK